MIKYVFFIFIFMTASVSSLRADDVRHVTPSQAAEILKSDDDIVILDVRTPREFNKGHIEGAVNYNYFSFGFRDNIKELDPNKTYVLHCKAGHRSDWSIPILQDAGITNIIHIEDGLDAWKENGLPVTQDM